MRQIVTKALDFHLTLTNTRNCFPKRGYKGLFRRPVKGSILSGQLFCPFDLSRAEEMAGRSSKGVPTGPSAKCHRLQAHVPAGRQARSPSVCSWNAGTYSHAGVFSYSRLSSEVLSAHADPLVNLITLAILLALEQMTYLAIRFVTLILLFLKPSGHPT